MFAGMLAAGHGGLIVTLIVAGFVILAAYSIYYLFFKVGK